MSINQLHPLYKEFAPLWKLCRDAAGGETQVKARDTEYLPRPSGMTETEYQAYKLRARFFGGPGRTLDGMLGQMFRKPPVLSGAKFNLDPTQGERGEGPFETLTPDGMSLSGLARHAAKEMLITGRLGLLADLPEPGYPGALAYLAPYSAEAILSWETKRIGSKEQLVSVVLEEGGWSTGVDPKDLDDFVYVTQIRHLGLRIGPDGAPEYFQQIYTPLDSSKENWLAQEPVVPQVRGQSLSYIPFVMVGTHRSYNPTKPPLLEVSHAALSYYRSSADYENALYFAGNPTPIATGVDLDQAEPLRMGSSQFNTYSSPDTKVFLLELSGKSVTELRENLNSKKAEIALLGLRMLETPKQAPESAANQAMRQEGEKSHLASLADELSERLSLALAYWSELSGLSFSPTLDLNTDYRPERMSVSEAAQLAQLVEQGYYPKAAYLKILKLGELLPADYEEEAPTT